MLKVLVHGEKYWYVVQDFACTRCPQACERFVDVLGLKILFSIFMGKSKVRQLSWPICMSRLFHLRKAIVAARCPGQSGMAHLKIAGPEVED